MTRSAAMFNWGELAQQCTNKGYDFSELDHHVRIGKNQGQYVEIVLRKNWNTLFCDFKIWNFIDHQKIVDLAVGFLENAAAQIECAVISFKTTSYAEKQFLLNRGFLELSQDVKYAEWNHLFKKNRYDVYFLKILDSDRWSKINLIAKKFKVALNKIRGTYPTLVLKLTESGYRYEEIAYYYEGQSGKFFITVEENTISIVESESKTNTVVLLAELYTGLSTIIDNIKTAKRLENVFQPPKHHFTTCMINYLTSNKKVQDDIYAVLSNDFTAEEIELKMVKKSIEFSFGIPFDTYIQCVKVLNTYFVCRYTPEPVTKSFKTKEEALMLFKTWGMEKAEHDVNNVLNQMRAFPD
jgi:hypothetical protein